MQDTQDIYSQMDFTGSPPTSYYRSSGGQFFYNNTIVSDWTHHSYTTYEDATPKDRFRNNIFRKIINLNWTGGAAGGYNPDEQYNYFDGEITNNPITKGTGSEKNQDFATNFFLGTGSGALVYRLHTSSIARDKGTVISGITDDDDGTPDLGAVKFADNAASWVADVGYNAVTLDDDTYIEDNNLVFTSYSVTPTVINNATYHGGTASFTNTDASVITITMTGTAFEWYAEEYNHAPIVRVAVDGVTQDCDTGTGGTQDCDLYTSATVNNSTLIFSKTGMSAGQHTITLTTNGRNVANTTGYFVVHDNIKTP